MRVGIILPTRGDRPEFLKNSIRMLEAQTLKPELIEIINDPPLNKEKDITYRYRMGYDRLRNKGLDLIAFWEDDDYYSPDYLEKMVRTWQEKGQPQLLGTDYTIYYHIKQFAYFYFHHTERSSQLSTLIKPDMNFTWCVDREPFTDNYLWTMCPEITQKVIFHPEKHLTIGIKHGIGMCGGKTHVDQQDRFIEKDHDKSFLKQHMDAESYKFYTNYFNQNL